MYHNLPKSKVTNFLKTNVCSASRLFPIWHTIFIRYDASYTLSYEKKLIASFLASCIFISLSAQKTPKHTFQYSPGINKKSIAGTITKMTNSSLDDQKLTWVHIGDTVIHVWEKDLKKEMQVGNAFSFNGIQKLTGVKKHLKN